MRYLIGIVFFLSILTAQVTDKNFKDNVSKGFVLVKFTAPYQMQDIDPKILKNESISKTFELVSLLIISSLLSLLIIL